MLLLYNQQEEENISLMDTVDCFRLDANRKINPATRSKFGQFMTNASVANFMASLFANMSGEIRLLDAGAGVGSLTAAFIQEACNRQEKPNTINATVYEIEPTFFEHLKETLSNCNELCSLNNIFSDFTFFKDDFIETNSDLLSNSLFDKNKLKEYSHVILNPPYKKILSSSKQRKLLSRIGIETSNLYTGFLAIAINLLQNNGEMVVIVPRSFCNGPYFKPFRKLLLSSTAFKHIHVFGSRKKAFKEDDVLQENIIFHAIKGGIKDKVMITSSHGPQFEDMTQRSVSYDKVIKPNDTEKFIHIAASDMDQYVVDRISTFNNSLEHLDIQVSTGPIVDFRLKEDLSKTPEKNTAPLLYPLHFNLKKIEWPRESKKSNYIKISKNSKKWLWPNKGYFVLTKRFTAKEEKKRIVAVVYDSSLPGELIGFENHLNVFHKGQKGLSKNIAYGLSVYLNSTLVDKYFRLFSGHTQVNSTDLRSLYYPSPHVLESLGSKIDENYPNQHKIDRLINEELIQMADKEGFDPVVAQQKIDEALEIVKALGLPRGQHNERSALTLLAILNLRPELSWKKSERPLMSITPIMDWCRNNYGKEYAPNTRETFRRQTMHQFVDAGIAVYNPDQPDRPVNSPKTCYQISIEAFDAILTFGTDKWEEALAKYLSQKETLIQRYAKERDMQMIPVELAKGKEIRLTPGVHSRLIKEIIKEFGPRFAPGSEVVYVGDTGDKTGYFQKDRLKELGVEIDRHGKMPDVVLYYPTKNWLLLIEAVTSHGPVDAKRHSELSRLFETTGPGLVYVTAFPDRTTMGRYLAEISWETEVWVSEALTHIIHFNGERFLGPYE